jgi:hypothetical protein
MRSATLRLSAATTVDKESKVMGAPVAAEDASERTEPDTTPAEEVGGAPEVAGVEGGTDGAGRGPDIADTKLLGFLTLPLIERRL